MENENMENQTEMQETVMEIGVEEPRSIMTTPISEYTVTEGLLLVLTLCVVAQWLTKILKRGFQWLLW